MADSPKNSNYTPEVLQKIVEMYNTLGNEGIDEIAEAVGKPPRSIRSKLVREGIYVASPKTSTIKADGPSKKELLREIEAKNFNVEGFEGATKVALSRLLGLLNN